MTKLRLMTGLMCSMGLLACPAVEPASDGGSAGGSAAGGSAAGGSAAGGSAAGGSAAGGSAAGGSAAGGSAVDAGPVQRDLDIAVVRLNTNGTLDTTFGDGGVAIIDFGQATGGLRDSLYGMDRDSTGRLVLFGSTRGAGRSDADRYVARLTATGQLDSTFATNGVHRLDISNLGDNQRHGVVLPDGKILSGGYTSMATHVSFPDGGAQFANRVVLLRLTSAGAPDPTFGDGGVVTTPQLLPANPATTLWGMAESYGVAMQSGGRAVSYGYGRYAPAGRVDQVSFRYDNAGAVDSTWGDGGTLLVDLIGGDERARHGVALPDDRIAIVGSGAPLNVSNIDAMVTLTTPNGALDTSFGAGSGYRLWNFTRADEAFWASAVGPGATMLAAAGYRTGPANTAAENDDALLLVLPLTGVGVEFAQPVPLDVAAHDRFYGVAWDGMKIVGAGFVRSGADTRFAAARFNADGTPDTTFGAQGRATFDLSVNGGTEETARWVVVQPDGKIVLAGVIER